MNAPITHAVGNDTDRCYKLCKCSVCGTVKTCTPTFDFYGKNGAPLRCEDCFRIEMETRGTPFVNLTPKDAA